MSDYPLSVLIYLSALFPLSIPCAVCPLSVPFLPSVYRLCPVPCPSSVLSVCRLSVLSALSPVCPVCPFLIIHFSNEMFCHNY